MTIQNDKNVNATDVTDVNDGDVDVNQQKRNHPEDNPNLKDADDNNGIVPDDALQKVNPAEAERLTDDHDPHHVVKNHKQYDTPITESDK